jgi:hypothetical protein
MYNARLCKGDDANEVLIKLKKIFVDSKINKGFDVETITAETSINDCIPVDNDCIFDTFLDAVEKEYWTERRGD